MDDRRIVRERIRFYGRVQGVGFRYQFRFAADNHGLTGWVRNCCDGSVEAEIQGDPDGIRASLEEIERGRFIRISGMDRKGIDPIPEERTFRVRGY